ncbi:MAG: trypsin-like peptidase domain-containing protein [Anaerolineae bacterium]
MTIRMRWAVVIFVVGVLWGGAALAVFNRAGTEAARLQPQIVTQDNSGREEFALVSLQPTPSPLPPDIISAADAEYRVLSNVYYRVAPSVVNIEVVVSLGNAVNQSGSGSGFIYDRAGHIVTNSHVVRDAEEILVTFRDGYVTEARLIGVDDFSDLAVIRVDTDPARLLPVTLGNSESLYVGQRVIAIGNPFGLESSMTTGVISALGRTLPSAQLVNPDNEPFNNPAIIQVDATINPGNSGGPLLDSAGTVIGVNTAIRTETGQFQGVGFAVPVSTVSRVVPDLIDDGRVAYSWLGISSLSAEGGFSVAGLAEPLGLPVTSGVLIQTVTPDSPADQAGLRGGVNNGTVIRGREIYVGGDIIVAINDYFVESMDDLVSYLVVNTRPGDTVTMTVVRDDQTLEIPVVLGSRPQ